MSDNDGFGFDDDGFSDSGNPDGFGSDKPEPPPAATLSAAAGGVPGPQPGPQHAKVKAKLAEIAAFLPQIEAELERVSAPGSRLSPALSKLVQTQLQAAIGIFKSDETATEAQIAEVKKSEIGAVRVSKTVGVAWAPLLRFSMSSACAVRHPQRAKRFGRLL